MIVIAVINRDALGMIPEVMTVVGLQDSLHVTSTHAGIAKQTILDKETLEDVIQCKCCFPP